MREGGRKQIGVVERKEDKEEREKGISLVIERVWVGVYLLPWR